MPTGQVRCEWPKELGCSEVDGGLGRQRDNRGHDLRRRLVLPSGVASGPPFDPSSLAEAARRIEAAGFESAWTFDSVGRGTLRRDPLMALAVAATVTRDIELGTGVLQVSLRNPVELATNLASGGRLRFGVGAGSTAEDFAALGIPRWLEGAEAVHPDRSQPR